MRKYILGFILMFSIWSINFLTTIIGLNLTKNIYEANKIPAMMFGLGVFGYMGLFWIVMLFCLGFNLFLNFVTTKANKKYENYIIFIPVGVFIILELYTILHNISLFT